MQNHTGLTGAPWAAIGVEAATTSPAMSQVRKITRCEHRIGDFAAALKGLLIAGFMGAASRGARCSLKPAGEGTAKQYEWLPLAGRAVARKSPFSWPARLLALI